MAIKQTKHRGLTTAEVEERRLKYGLNTLTPPPKPSLWQLYWEKFEDPVIRILLVVASVSLVIAFFENDYTETIGIILAIFLATAIGFYFEYDANKKFEVLNKVNDETPVTVVRNGEIHNIPRAQLVPGDIVMIETGDEVPADGVLLEALSLQVNESSLTGELQADKTTDTTCFDAEATYPSNALMKGTTILSGHGILQVEHIGDATEIGKVARQSSEIVDQETPLKQQLSRLAHYIGMIGFSVAGLVFLTLYIRNIWFDSSLWIGVKLVTLDVLLVLLIATVRLWMPAKLMKRITYPLWVYLLTALLFGCLFLIALLGVLESSIIVEWSRVEIYFPALEAMIDYFLLAVALVVVCVPEGLPMSVTLSLALNMRRMLVANNLVRKMHASETMGAITTICSDKTGTLTLNKMTVRHLEFYAQVLHHLNQCSTLKSALVEENIALNSTAFLEENEGQSPKTIGNPTEGALLTWLYEQKRNYMDLREQMNVLAQMPFSTERKYMATLVYSHRLSKHILYVKGASEVLLDLSTGIYREEEIQTVAANKNELEQQLFAFQEKAMRTLGFAYMEVEDPSIKIEELLTRKALVFYGFVAIADPVRHEVPQAIEDCKKSGIDVKIVTGDTSATAIQIAREIGIWEDATQQAHLTGTAFASMTDEELKPQLKNLKVLSRSKPTDKQRLVHLLQEQQEVVAVTGDGTNDAPALNHAQVGLSMGSGTSVAKDASDITIIDDSFASITKAVMWGRSLYKNIQRFIVFQLTINVVAMIVVLLGSFFEEVAVLTVTQMLWVNLIMDTLAALALASLPPNEAVMQEKPRDKNAFIITRPMFRQILGYGIFFLLLMGGFVHYALGLQMQELPLLNLFFTFFVFLQFWNLINVSVMGETQSAFKHLFKRKGLCFVLTLILGSQVLIVELGGAVFRTQPLSISTWIILFLTSSIVLWMGEVIRWVQRKKG
jgi:Ca2+-transporting ATPase